MRPPLRVPVRSIASGEHALDREAAHYVVRVHRLREGAVLVLFDAEARTEADATVVATGRDAVRVEIGPVREASRVAGVSVTLIQAVAKGAKMDAIVRDATELGATRIVPVLTTRAVAEGAASTARWRRIVLEAARQAGRGDVPTVMDPKPLTDALRDATETLRIALAPDAIRSIGELLREEGDARSVAIAIGPEGGFDGAELEMLAKAGFVKARLGRFTLRTETAATAALAVVADHAPIAQ